MYRFLTIVAPCLLSLLVVTDKPQKNLSLKLKICIVQQNVWCSCKAYLNCPYFPRPASLIRSTDLPNSRQFKNTKKIGFNLCMLAILSLQTPAKTCKCKTLHKLKKKKRSLYLKQLFGFWGLVSPLWEPSAATLLSVTGLPYYLPEVKCF